MVLPDKIFVMHTNSLSSWSPRPGTREIEALTSVDDGVCNAGVSMVHGRCGPP